MNKLFVFNPGHEEALRIPLEQTYTASKEVLKLRADLASLMLYFAEEGDYVWLWAKDGKADCLVNHQGKAVEDYDNLPTLKLCPWALEGHLLKSLRTKAKALSLRLEFPTLSETYLHLSHRSASLRMLQHLNETWQNCEALYPTWFYPKDDEAFAESLNKHLNEQEESGAKELLLKRAFTSSGRGLTKLSLPLSAEEQQRIWQQAKRWQGISLETRLELLEDWAVEYYIDDAGNVNFVALSKFETNHLGAYQANLLKSQELLFAELEEFLGQDLQRLIDCHKAFFREKLKGLYQGYIGVDMLVYKSNKGEPKLHPCVEINLRCTMGLVAHLVYKQLQEKAVDYASKPLSFHVDFLPKSTKQLESFPNTNSHLLTPIDEETSFVAYVKEDA